MHDHAFDDLGVPVVVQASTSASRVAVLRVHHAIVVDVKVLFGIWSALGFVLIVPRPACRVILVHLLAAAPPVFVVRHGVFVLQIVATGVLNLVFRVVPSILRGIRVFSPVGFFSAWLELVLKNGGSAFGLELALLAHDLGLLLLELNLLAQALLIVLLDKFFLLEFVLNFRLFIHVIYHARSFFHVDLRLPADHVQDVELVPLRQHLVEHGDLEYVGVYVEGLLIFLV